MAEEFNRIPGETGAYGYRQLPGSGPARGVDLKTLSYGVIGVAMGIVVGTLAADGTLRSMIHTPALHSVSASTQTPKPPTPPAAVKPTQTPSFAIQANTQIPKPPAAPVATRPAQTLPFAFLASVPSIQKPASVSKPATGGATALKVSAPAKALQVHKLGSRRRHFGRRRIHGRHRLHLHLKPKAVNTVAANPVAPKPVESADIFSFMVEGEVTVASYNASLGRIETFEGQTFALNQVASASDIMPLDSFPGNLHYRCDQTWNCTLSREGAAVLTAHRTK